MLHSNIAYPQHETKSVCWAINGGVKIVRTTRVILKVVVRLRGGFHGSALGCAEREGTAALRADE
jgi:hypothetical protein